MTIERIMIFGLLLVFTVAIFVSIIEYFIPLSEKIDVNYACRAALLKMEQQGELNDGIKTDLETELLKLGMRNISIQSVGGSSQGSKLTLEVRTEFVYSKLTGFFNRQDVVQPVSFVKSVTVRKVVN